MLQARINELNSGIINIVGDTVMTLGFLNADRLYSYETNGIKNWYSMGRYKYENIEFHSIKSGAIFVLQENGQEIARYQFLPILRDTASYLNEKRKKTTLAFEIRKDTYSTHYNFKTEKQSLLFGSIVEITKHMIQTYDYTLNIDLGVEPMDKMILVDLETGGFQVEDGILEVGAVVVENGSIVEMLHLGKVEDEEIIYEGMGAGYDFIEHDEKYLSLFKELVDKYNYPLVAHNASFDRKFLVHYGWIPEDYPVYDSIRALKIRHPHLFSYSMGFVTNYFDVEQEHAHTALSDVLALHMVIQKAQLSTWIPLFKPLPSKFGSKAKSFIERGMKLQGESAVFKGKHMVFTGVSQFPRVLMQEIAIACGASVGNSVNKKTDYLICGEKVGQSKINRAIELEVPIYHDDWFIDIVFKDLSIEHVKSEVSATLQVEEIKKNVKPNPFENSPYKKLVEFEGKKVNVACLKLNIQSRIIELLEGMGASVVKSPGGKKVDYMIYTDNGDYALLKEADKLNIIVIPVSRFNRMLLD
ncbi:hypothetical protein JSQ81_02510 [Sporosarcina sp. Marseille-Q4063]|uniref:BRCT domain-containing protein n=1 Tax=Sporosarcina sp. Marseille-Q4063 TaxID=2810514 RepID=UPI001BAF7506|nr:BRCT domain-containing protein [Sporosarcina sp. Marseille-Q4063]QUW22479.1 hypothetical protein JSQ81_02510 [Sporosarcina sp. Marseille-Q4063]